MFVVETRLAFPGADGGDTHQEHSLTVLVLSNPDETSRRRLRAEVPRYVGARTWIAEFPADDWAGRVVEHLHALEPAFLDLVIGLQEPRDQAVLQVCHLLEQLRVEGRHHLGTLVAVASPEVARPATAEQLGWVLAPQMPAAEGAMLLHAGLAQLSAPDLIEEVSAEDLAGVWGSAAQPACLISADAGQLCHLPVWSARGRVAAFCLVSAQFGLYQAMVRDLSALGAENPLIVVAARLTLPGRAIEGWPCVIVTAAGRVGDVTKPS
ncbi:hypothetical protein [Roseateles puraquae]|uniref:hypothetical protein n=1 Tax=Roseateles puraquae TaxID=431059 RepID=UPI0013031545|nr:hypothetical protein [Roseateles puraquae]MDG0853381.1 hypothetical protein [Roseateles puraquae]